jgi:hypothetical protein
MEKQLLNGTLNMDSHQINNVANGTSAQDAVTLSQLTRFKFFNQFFIK